MNGKNTALLLIILLVVIWFIGAIYYYTCHVKSYCGVSTGSYTYVERNNYDDSYDNYQNDYTTTNTKKKVTKTYTCSAFLKGFIKYGRSNSVKEVAKLEKFLIDHRGADVKLDGYYSSTDRNYVKQLQQEYNLDDDGIVGAGTRKVVNEIYCKAKVEEYKKDN